jgi:hypothetical protein
MDRRKTNIKHLSMDKLFFALTLLFIGSSVFATPNGKDLPTACEHALAREVTDGLATAPELLAKTADVSAGTILKSNYPCAE